MKDEHILQKLREIPDKTWKDAINKCHTHIDLKLWNKTSSGAHCEQRLGTDAKDFYVEKASSALFDGEWEWKYEQFSIDEQLIRIINSMISEQVRKYRVEIKRGQKTILVGNDQLALYLEDDVDEPYDDTNLQKFFTALQSACEHNEKYLLFIRLKQQDLSYDQIAKEMKCTKEDLYRMMEKISRRAKSLLKSLK